MPSLGLQQDVDFPGAQGLRLSGTLMMPDVAVPVPGMLLLPGSGPTDRDGNQPPHLVSDLLKLLAEALAGFGIASLRFDKRGIGAGRAMLPTDPEALADFVRWEHFVADAAAGLAFLRAREGIDARRVGILGHSEGGMLALEVARSAPPPATLVLASTPGRTIGAVLRDQLERTARRQGAPEAAIAAVLDENDRIVAQVAAGQGYPPSIHPGLAALYPAYLKHYWRGFAASDPAALAAACTVPVLVVSGTADVQVPIDKDVPALAAALERRTGTLHGAHRVVGLAGASHILKPAAEASQDFGGPLHPDVAPALKNWFSTLGWTGA